MIKEGLCFSGGGIKAFSHIGALKALEERYLKFDMVAGTSSGSIIAVLYALGYSSEEMYKILNKYVKKIKYVDTKNIFKIIGGLLFTGKIVVDGLNSGNILTKAMNDVCRENKVKNINDLKMPIVIPAVDLQNGEVIVFSSKEIRGKISDKTKYITDAPIDIAVRSSCSFPGVFSPCVYNKKQLVDGGVRENVAWRELKDIGADRVLGINFSTYMEKDACCENMIEIAVRSMNLMEHELSNYELNGIDELITIPTGKVGLLDTSKINYLYKTGYKIAKKYIDDKMK
jgi:NTE family protein